ncbi:ParB N-terminal domain-containing protein [Fictibacillus sp. NRS-1165]|uniref:ParB N-terminal domain-containing protein n=1 Tax=Fictibacillus sp. NRS-1165 TaxID=3144463 RepID=UPI003D22F704
MENKIIGMKKMNIHDLQPALYNPRKSLKPHDEEYQRIRKSILDFGYISPITFNQRTSNIVGGHQRWTVLKDLGYEELDVFVVDFDEEKEMTANAALNKAQGDWDKNKLADYFLYLDEKNYDVEMTGFGYDEIEKLLHDSDELIQQPEVEFSEELMEEHNYIVLYFDNSMDWQVAKEKFGVKPKAGLDSKEGYERKGTGRVFNGSEFLDRIQ